MLNMLPHHVPLLTRLPLLPSRNISVGQKRIPIEDRLYLLGWQPLWMRSKNTPMSWTMSLRQHHYSRVFSTTISLQSAQNRTLATQWVHMFLVDCKSLNDSSNWFNFLQRCYHYAIIDLSYNLSQATGRPYFFKILVMYYNLHHKYLTVYSLIKNSELDGDGFIFIDDLLITFLA